MELNDKLVNELLEKYKQEVDFHNYPSNISHLLYLIVPAFIIHYGFDNERKILDTFNNVPVLISDTHDKTNQAYYISIPFNDKESIYTRKVIVLKNYENISLMNLLDNLVHEYNHAMNSMINEIRYDDNYVKLRTGLCFNIYNRSNMEFIKKEDDYILEEIINTKQTEEIINVINSFSNYHIEDSSIETTLYNIKNNINGNYNSDSYGLGSTLCKELMNNRTFISTLGKLRLKGEIDDLEYWFDNITGEEGSYKKLVNLLLKSQKLEKEYDKAFFKNRKLNQIKSVYNDAMLIINTFNNNSNFR